LLDTGLLLPRTGSGGSFFAIAGLDFVFAEITLLVLCLTYVYLVSSEVSGLRNFWLHTMCACTE